MGICAQFVSLNYTKKKKKDQCYLCSGKLGQISLLVPENQLAGFITTDILKSNSI